MSTPDLGTSAPTDWPTRGAAHGRAHGRAGGIPSVPGGSGGSDGGGHPGTGVEWAFLCSDSGRVRARPPSRPGGYWRVSRYDEDGHRIGQTTGGLTREDAARRVAEEERRMTAAGLPGAAATRGEELFDFFLSDARPKFPHSGRRHQEWSANYRRQAGGLIDRYLRPVLGPVRLAVWAPPHAYRALDRCPTNYVVRKARRVLSAVVTVGLENGFLRADQAGLHRVAVPLRTDVRPSRRPLVPARGDQPQLLLPGEVPSEDQVRALAESGAALPARCRAWWQLWVYLLAYGGLREGELFALTAPDVLEAGRPLVSVTWQVEEPPGSAKRLAPPKNGTSRLAVVCRTTPQGAALWDLLLDRAAAALDEQRRGTNPRALIAPAPGGGWWSRSNFRSRCFVPAALAAGWETLPWQGPVRRRVGGRWCTVVADRRDFRHTLHALRHHYACTARDRWGWNGAELCASGGWSDIAFVIARYYGSTADVHTTAIAKQRDAERPRAEPHGAQPDRAQPGRAAAGSALPRGERGSRR